MTTSSPISGGEQRQDPLPYRERVADLRQVLLEQGSLGLLLIDVSAVAQIEHQYGSSSFERVMGMARDLVLELRGHEVRAEDF